MKKNDNIIKIGEDFKKNNSICMFCILKDIYECYTRPSTSKIDIYNYYYRLLVENGAKIHKYGIISYNTFMITLGASITLDGKDYFLKITPAHNYYKEIL